MKSNVEKKLPSDRFESYFERVDDVLLLLGIRIHLSGDRAIANGELRKMKPWPLYTFLILGTHSIAGQYFYARDSMRKNQIFLAAQVIGHLLSNVSSIAKNYRLVFIMSDLEGTLQQLAGLWQKYLCNHQMRAKFFKKAKNTLILCKIFIYATFCTVMSFCSAPLYNLFNEYVHRKDLNYTHNFEQRIFFIKYPFEVNSFSRYLAVMMQEAYLIVGAGLLWVAGDLIFAHLTTHIALQLEVLQYDMASLINDSVNDNTLKRGLRKLIKRHQQLLRICDQLEYMFSPVILSTVLLAGINLCFNVFEAHETMSKGKYADASVHILLFTITLLQVLFYCTFAEGLTQESIMLANAVYNCNWSEKNNMLAVYLQMIMMRSQSPVYCTAYGFFPIGHTRLSMILNGACSYYMMLQARTK